MKSKVKERNKYNLNSKMFGSSFQPPTEYSLDEHRNRYELPGDQKIQPRPLNLRDNMEEGEVQFINEEENPYIADPNFKFKTDPFHKINWRNVQKVNFNNLKMGLDLADI